MGTRTVLLAAQTPGLMFLAGLTLLTVLLLRRTWANRRRAQRKPRPSSIGGRPTTRDWGLIDAPVEINRWEVAMHETARDLQAELDSKIRVLQTLIPMAQQECERLEAAVRDARQLGISDHRDLLQELDEMDPRYRDFLIPETDGRSESAEAETEFPLSDEQRRAVFQLADQGAGVARIARSLDLPAGDVEWLLNYGAPVK